jgi:hypothetical protein
MPLAEVVTDKLGRRGISFARAHPGQIKALYSDRRIVAVIAGTRGGKTSLGPLWLYLEMLRCGAGDYLIAAPSYPLLDKAAAPEVQDLFEGKLRLGSMRRSPLCFNFSEAGCKALGWGKPDRQPRIIFGHADDPDSLEAMGARAAWLDEAGQKRFRLQSFEAIQRRLAIDRGRILITTTPYDLGWLKQRIFDPWEEARRRGNRHSEIEVVQFHSIDNPTFPREEWERARRDMPGWRFRLFYRAEFTRPAGLIYGSFDSGRHVRPAMRIPERWPRYVALDFGATNTAAVFFAEEQIDDRPTGQLVIYREYHPGEKLDPQEHVREILKGEPRLPVAIGGNPQEDEWRAKFLVAGLPVQPPPIRDVEVGIDTVFAAFARNEIVVHDDCVRLLDQLASYSREVDDQGEPTDKIDSKSSYHLLDSLRYGLSWIRQGGFMLDPTPDPRARSEVDRLPQDVWGMAAETDDGKPICWGESF